MKRLLIAATGLLLSACSSLSDINRHNRTTFEPMPDGTFRMRASDSRGTLLQVRDYKDEWIASYVRENNICKEGYSVSELQPIFAGREHLLGGDNLTRHYVIKCN